MQHREAIAPNRWRVENSWGDAPGKKGSVIETMKSLPTAKLPFDIQEIQIKITDRGCLIEAPLEDNEQIYGFGLQFETFGQRGLRKRPIVNDNPLN